MVRVVIILSAWLVSILAGCSQPPVAVELDVKGVRPAADYSNLAVVLHQAVDSQGQVLPDALERCADRLDAQLKLLAVTGPTATPALFARPDDRLAYWYNASAAWSMKLALLAKFPEEMNPRELHHRPFPLDGRKMTLHEIRQLLQKEEDFRVALLAPCVCVQAGPLPATPLAGANVRQRIAEAFNRYVADPKRLVIVIEDRRILFPMGLWRVRDELIRRYDAQYGAPQATLATVLMPYVRGAALRRLQDAVGYREEPAQETGLLALPDKFDFLKKSLW
jgi:hypothetical protein